MIILSTLLQLTNVSSKPKVVSRRRGGEKADANPFSEAEADVKFYLSEDEINATKLKEKGISTSDDPSTPMMPSEERL